MLGVAVFVLEALLLVVVVVTEVVLVPVLPVVPVNEEGLTVGVGIVPVLVTTVVCAPEADV